MARIVVGVARRQVLVADARPLIEESALAAAHNGVETRHREHPVASTVGRPLTGSEVREAGVHRGWSETGARRSSASVDDTGIRASRKGLRHRN